jgi:uncharacterized protein YegL
MATKATTLLEDIRFASTSNKRIPVLFAVDCSSSMNEQAIDGEGVRRAKIDGVQQGLRDGLAYLRNAADLRYAARVGVLAFGDDVQFTGFQDVDDLQLPSLTPRGATPMCEALRQAAEETFLHAVKLNDDGQTASMTTIVVVTDGAPTDGDGQAEVTRLLDLQRAKRCVVWAVGIDSEDRARLEALGFPASQVVTVQETSWATIIELGTVSAAAIARGQQPFGIGGVL